MVSPASHKIARVSWYSGSRPKSAHLLYGTLTRSGRAFQRVRVLLLFFVACPTTPASTNTSWFGLLPVRSPLLRESRLISSRRATEMFQFTRCPPHGLCVQPWVSRHHSGWVAPFGFSRFFACMQLPLNVSPVSASFFGFKRQGIHLVLLLACSLSVCFFLCFNSC